MTVREFFEEIRTFPDWDVDLLVAVSDKDYGLKNFDVKEVIADDFTGDIVMKLWEHEK